MLESEVAVLEEVIGPGFFMSISPLSHHHFTPFDKAAELLGRSVQNAGIYGLTGSAPAFLLAAAVRKGARTFLLVVPDGERASVVSADIRFYLACEDLFDEPLRDEVLCYPSSDALPYSFAGFESDVSLTRMACLYRLAEAKAPRVIVIGLDALIRKVIPRAAFRRTCFSLHVGEDMDREILLELLDDAGYVRSPLVEEPGDFSVRGFIIDVYPALYPYPIRIEQVGDQIESIRFFDPSNQRSKNEVGEIQIGPIHMLVPDRELRERGLRIIRETCEDRGVEKRVRQRLLDDFQHGIRFPGAENYLPYFYAGLESLTDYLPRDTTVMLPDADTMARAFEDVEEELFRGWESAAGDGLPVPEPEALFLSRAQLLQSLSKFRTVIMSPLEIEESDREGVRLRCRPNTDVRPELAKSKTYDSGMAGLVKRLEQWRDDGNEVFLVSHTQGQANRLLRLLEPYPLNLDFRGEGFDLSNLISDPTPGIRLYVGELSSGFRLEEAGRIILTEEEIFGSRVRTTPKKRAAGTLLSSLTDLVEGEPIVHEDYGIGIFRGLAKKQFEGVSREVMVIEYAGGDILYQPLERLQTIQKYVSGSEAPPKIDRLGGKGWEKTKAKVKHSIREMAKQLLEIYAKRSISKRSPYAPLDENYAEFEATFEFEETPDQIKAIQDVHISMDSDVPMDRLVCGDVGFGKTEVALRAAFRSIMDGKQVAVLVPTTVLAQQHYDTCIRRFQSYPITVEMLSRFRTPTEQKAILKRIRAGKIDLIVGTHRLLQKDVVFKDLGLLVVDEEHRFGVAHKEKIKQYRAYVDVLTLTATPIPRTLNLSLSGIRDLSLIETPPTNRRSIRTHVMRQSDEVVRDALLREISRGGQAFYLHNRVKTIYKRAVALQKLVPEAHFGIAHGQMPAKDLERVMLDFVTGRFNVLVCTSIIESGLDIPRVNTIIIERGDTFGLADLYQLRGRVGRSSVRAYCYLLTPSETLMTPDAIKRLAVIQEHSSLGQGFRIAMRDLEIRGAGNLLGTAQSGHVAQVGYEMYLELLGETVAEMKGEPVPSKIDPEISLRIEALIPEEYVPDARQRMNLYKRLSRAETSREIDLLEDEILDLYGKPPLETSHLVRLMRIRLLMKEVRISKLDYTGQDLVLSFDSETPANPDFLISWAHQSPDQVRIIPGDRVLYRIGKTDTRTRIRQTFELLERIREEGLSPPQESAVGNPDWVAASHTNAHEARE